MNEGNAAAKRVHARISGEVVRDERGDATLPYLQTAGRAGSVSRIAGVAQHAPWPPSGILGFFLLWECLQCRQPTRTSKPSKPLPQHAVNTLLPRSVTAFPKPRAQVRFLAGASEQGD